MSPRTVLAVAALWCALGAPLALAQGTPKPRPPFKLPPDAKVMTSPSGLQFVDVVAGTGKSPKKGDLCIVHYTAWLEDGTQVDTSKRSQPRDPRDPSKGEKILPFGFRVGTGQVIPGWDEGVSTMREGGKRMLFIPPLLGYGDKGLGGAIPPSAHLTFEVELLKIREETTP